MMPAHATNSLIIRDDDPNPKVIPGVQRVPQETFLAVMWTFVALSLVFIIFRLIARIRSFRKLFADDYLAIASWLMFLASSIFWQIKAHVMFELYKVQTGEIPFTMEFLDAYSGFLPHVVTLNTLFYTSLWSVKLSFLLFFYRLGAGQVREHKIWWWIVVVISIGAWVACIADIDYPCSVGDIMWIFQNCDRTERVLFEARTFYANMAADVFTDILITSIPFLILWNVRIPTKKRILLAIVFGATILIMAFAIIRVVLVKGTQNIGTQEASIDWLYFWSNLEMGVAIIVACLASFRQLFVSGKKQQEQEELGRWPRSQPDSAWHRNVFSFFGTIRPTAEESSTAVTESRLGNGTARWGWTQHSTNNPQALYDESKISNSVDDTESGCQPGCDLVERPEDDMHPSVRSATAPRTPTPQDDK